MQLHCPFCGWREADEFECRGTAPEPGTDPVASLYERVNRPELSSEYWQHTGGCRSWLKLQRNPSTGEVLSTEMLAAAAQRGTHE